MAFRKLMPEKYGDFHNQLLEGKGRATEAAAIKIALSLGVDEAALREEMKNPAITEEFAKTYDLANKLTITGTPVLCGRQRGGLSARSARMCSPRRSRPRAPARRPAAADIAQRRPDAAVDSGTSRLRSFGGSLCPL